MDVRTQVQLTQDTVAQEHHLFASTRAETASRTQLRVAMTGTRAIMTDVLQDVLLSMVLPAIRHPLMFVQRSAGMDLKRLQRVVTIITQRLMMDALIRVLLNPTASAISSQSRMCVLDAEMESLLLPLKTVMTGMPSVLTDATRHVKWKRDTIVQLRTYLATRFAETVFLLQVRNAIIT